MGMFDADKEYGNNIVEMFGFEKPFIVYGARITAENVQTKFGGADRATFEVAHLEVPSDRYECTTLAGAITAKVREAEPSDFPAVVMLKRVPTDKGSDAVVLRFLKAYRRTDGAAPVPAPVQRAADTFDAQAANMPAHSTVGADDDDIAF